MIQGPLVMLYEAKVKARDLLDANNVDADWVPEHHHWTRFEDGALEALRDLLMAVDEYELWATQAIAGGHR